MIQEAQVNLAYAAKRLFRVVVKKHPKLEKKLPRLPELKKDQEDADFVICPAGEHSIRKAVQGSKKSGESRSLVFYFDTERCKTCPLREGCLKPGAKSKTYSIRMVAEHFKEQIEFENSDTFKERIRRRPIIKHKNAELKRFHGMTKAKYRGLFRMRIQAVLTAFVVNCEANGKAERTNAARLLKENGLHLFVLCHILVGSPSVLCPQPKMRVFCRALLLGVANIHYAFPKEAGSCRQDFNSSRSSG